MLSTLRNGVASALVAVANRIRPATADLSVSAFEPAFIGEGWEVKNPNPLPANWSPRDLKWAATPLCPGETSITGAENKKRLADAGVHLRGIEAFWRCWQNRHLIPEELKDKIIFFDGEGDEMLRRPSGRRYSLCLYWRGGGWRWSYGWLGFGRRARYVSACAS